MKLGRLALVVIGLAAAGLPRAAWAQIESREGIALQNQILQLQQQVQALAGAQAAGQGAGAPSSSSALPPPVPQGAAPPAPDAGGANDTVASLLVRVSALEEQMRQLSGRVDDLTNQLQKQNDDLSKQIGDLAFKLGQGAQPAAPGQPADTPPAAPPAALPKPVPPPPAKRAPEIALRAGNAALARRDYTAAAAAAREVLASGQGPRATDAQLLLARAESGQKQHKQAAADYYAAYSKAPRASSAPVALLGVANSLIALNDPKDACQALAKLHAEFPDPTASVKQGLSAARKRASCP